MIDATKVVDRRPEYAAKLRKFADDIENGANQPIGFFLTCFWAGSGGITIAEKQETGFPNLAAAGFFLRLANAISVGNNFS